VCGAGLVTGRERTLGRCLRCPGAPDEQLAASLRQWRELVSAEQGVPASIVLTDETLVAVEERRPATEADLRDIPGFRPDKITAYGSRVLAIVAEAGTPEAAEPAEPEAAQPAPPGAAHPEQARPGAALAEVGKNGGQPESD
jgi:ribonuclease D